MDPVTSETVIVASPDQVSSEMNGEVVVLNHRAGVYFGLDAGVGALVWKQVQEPVRVSDLVSAVLDAYQVDAERCTRDVTGLVSQMLEAGIVERGTPRP